MNKSHLRGATSIGALILALAAHGAAMAQDSQESPQTDLGDVVVTATRREQSVLDVPYNISAVSGEAIEDAKMTDSAELMRGIPGVSVVDRGYRNSGVINNVLMRGINVDSNALGDYAVSSVAPVSTYINDTPIFAGFLLKDLERVEILRGPQGTLYGSGSLGGTVRYITRAPKLGVFEGAANLTGSSVEGSESIGWGADLTLNVPLGETLAFRGTVSRLDYPGLTDYVNLYVLDGTGAPAAPGGILSPDAA
ncbi:MAG: TonB-dependent receptor plug domain-containing protein, partial [Brevundimonas sp.]|nr:TonB-dependent receptor plug domain-containing protein [Brevundimonas sp.]